MKNFNVDIHTHNTLKPFGNNYPRGVKSVWQLFDNLCEGLSDEILELAEPGVRRATQTSFVQAAAGNVKIIGTSLFTYEDGWTREAKNKRKVISCLTGLSREKLLDIFLNKIDIYTDIWSEQDFLVKQMNTTAMAGGKQWQLKFLTKEILQSIDDGSLDIENETTIYVFLSIEGIQSLGIRSVQVNADSTELSDEDTNKIIARIKAIKNEWEALPQYITFCHHFGNRLAGHARTIPPFLDFLGVDQKKFMYEGITENGFKVIDALIKGESKRILPDIKHFSALARKEYYNHLDTNYPGQKIPIVCSHTGFMNEFEKLDDLSEETDEGSDLKMDYLFNWSVNLCKEDLVKIQASGGIIGVQTDLKRLVGKKFKKLVKKASGAEEKRLVTEIVWANIFTAIAYLNNKEAWDLFCIGSDYDGIVSFLPGFETLAEMPSLRNGLTDTLATLNFKYMKEIRVNGIFLSNNEIQRLMFGYSAAEIIEKIFAVNAISFWKIHFVNQQVEDEVIA